MYYLFCWRNLESEKPDVVRELFGGKAEAIAAGIRYRTRYGSGALTKVIEIERQGIKEIYSSGTVSKF